MRVGEDFCLLVGAVGPIAHLAAPVWEAACLPLRVTKSLQ
jgi:hypothetical protein